MRTLFFISFLIFLLSSLNAQPKLERGKELLAQGKAADAIALFRDVATTSPKNIDAWLLLGESFLQMSWPDSARQAARTAVSIDDENVDGHVLMAKADLAKRNFAEAYITLRKALKKNKNNPQLLTQLGWTLFANDSTDQAIIAFSQAKESSPGYAPAYEGLGDSYSKQGATSIAILQYEKALELDSLHAGVYYKLAKAYLKERRYTEAVRTYQSVVSLDSTNNDALFELGKILYEKAKRYGQAAQILRKYLQRVPGSLEAEKLALDASLKSRQYTEALAVAQKILHRSPKSVYALRGVAQSQNELRQYEHSLASYERLKTLDTLRADDLRRIGKAFAETKRDSLAVRYYEESLRLDSAQTDLYGELGSTYMRMRKFDKAALLFMLRFTEDPNSTVSYVNFALSSMALERWVEAKEALERALALKSDYLPGHLNLARCLLQLDSLKRAVREYEEVIKLADTATSRFKSEVGEAKGIIGLSFLLEKKYPQAIELLTASIQLRGDNWQTHLWLAQALALSNKREEAAKEYKRVLKLDPKNKDAKKGLEILDIR